MTVAPTTYFEQLTLRNFRRFEELTVDFDHRLTVFVADNGGGKTAILDGLATAIRYFVDELHGVGTHGFEKTDVRFIQAETGTMVHTPPTSLDASACLDGHKTQWKRDLATLGGKTTHKDAAMLKFRAQQLLHVNKEYAAGRSPPPLFPVIAYYGTGRLWSEHKVTAGKKSAAKNLSLQVDAYQDCLSPSSSYGQFVVWFESIVREAQNEHVTGVTSPHRPNDLVKAVRNAANIVLGPSEWAHLDWDFIVNEVVAVHPRQGRLSVNLLSDGIRNLIALVADLAHRAVRLNPHLGEHACEACPGIVLIDEVDMHLHPSWQQSVIGLLQTAFPAMQFIVTTHSPQLASTVDNKCLRVVRADGSIFKPAQQTRGVESSAILAEVMGVDPLPPVLEARWVTDYKNKVEQGEAETAEARELWEKILVHFGEQHPVVLDCKRLLRWQAFKLQRASGGAATEERG